MTWPIETFDPITQTFVADTDLPNPDTIPYRPSVRSNAQVGQDLNGNMVQIFPQRKYQDLPINLQWTRHSGSQLINQIRRYITSGTGVRIFIHDGSIVSGTFTELDPQMRPGFASGSFPLAALPSSRHTRWDIRAVFQPFKADFTSGS